MFHRRRSGPKHHHLFGLWAEATSLLKRFKRSASHGSFWYSGVWRRLVWLVNGDHSTHRQLSRRSCAAFFLSTFPQPFLGSRRAFKSGCLQAKGPIEIQTWSLSHGQACLSDFRIRNRGFLIWAVINLQPPLAPAWPSRLIPSKSLLWWVPPL